MRTFGLHGLDWVKKESAPERNCLNLFIRWSKLFTEIIKLIILLKWNTHYQCQARMSKIIVVAASKGRIFKDCGFEKNTECIWASGARTLHEKENPRRLQNIIVLALKKSPRLIITYADTLLNSLPTEDPRFQSLKKYQQNPEQKAVHLRKVGSELEQRGVETLTVIGKRPALPGNHQEELCKACARTMSPFSELTKKETGLGKTASTWP